MPQRASGYDVNAWLGRLGVKNPERPNLGDLYAPVVVLGDHSDQMAPLRPAVGIAGALLGVVVGSVNGMEVTGNGNGGTYVQVWHSGTGTMQTLYRLSATPMVFTLSAPLALKNEDARFPTKSTIRTGSSVAANCSAASDFGRSSTTNAESLQPSPTWYLPPGRFLWVEANIPANALNLAVLLRDVPGNVDLP